MAHKVHRKGRVITLNQAKNLRSGQTIYMREERNSDGSAVRWRVTGKVKLWKRSPDRVQVPLKHGLYTHGYLDESNLHLFSLEDPTAKRNPAHKTQNPRGKANIYHYSVTGPQGGKYLTSTMAEARKLTRNGGTIKKLKTPRKG